MWDLRMKENGGCLKRIRGLFGDNFYVVFIFLIGNIVVGGVDRIVIVYDFRRLVINFYVLF